MFEHTNMSLHTTGGHKTAYSHQFPPCTTWVLGLNSDYVAWLQVPLQAVVSLAHLFFLLSHLNKKKIIYECFACMYFFF